MYDLTIYKNDDYISLKKHGKILNICTKMEFSEWLQETLVMFELVYEDDLCTRHKSK